VCFFGSPPGSGYPFFLCRFFLQGFFFSSPFPLLAVHRCPSSAYKYIMLNILTLLPLFGGAFRKPSILSFSIVVCPPVLGGWLIGSVWASILSGAGQVKFARSRGWGWWFFTRSLGWGTAFLLWRLGLTPSSASKNRSPAPSAVKNHQPRPLGSNSTSPAPHKNGSPNRKAKEPPTQNGREQKHTTRKMTKMAGLRNAPPNNGAREDK